MAERARRMKQKFGGSKKQLVNKSEFVNNFGD